MKDINMTDSYQAHLPVLFTLNIESIRQKWHCCCDWQRATPISHVQNIVSLIINNFLYIKYL